MANGTNRPPAHFVVDEQVVTTGKDRNGNFVRGYQVMAKLDSGTPFQAFIPFNEYNVANVTTVLQAVANEVAAVEGLGR